MKTSYIYFLLLCYQFSFSQGNVGIGTTSPQTSALLHVHTGASVSKGLLVSGTDASGTTVPDLAAGSRLMFYPGKAAFRAGAVDGAQWNNVYVGRYSVATGYNTLASGDYGTAFGYGTTAGGVYGTAMGYGTSANAAATSMGYATAANAFYSTAMGRATTANGESSTAMGYSTTAGNLASTAMGYLSKANGYISTAMGNGTTASGAYSTAMGQGASAGGEASAAIGYFSNASANYSFAVGNQSKASGLVSFAAGDGAEATSTVAVALGSMVVASGPFSIAMGRLVSTNGFKGGVSLGDSDPNNEGMTYHGSSDQLVARFWNGYYFMTSGTNIRSGVLIGHNGNAWVSICDKNAKENFEPVDGDHILQKLRDIRFTSWNYKQQDPKIYRHYGIMAQDFYKAFGHDSYGIIGNDTTVNPIDMIGIDMAAIQALERKTTTLQEQNDQLQQTNKELEKRLERLEQLLKNK